MDNRGESLVGLLPRVVIRRSIVTVTQCPVLKARVDALLRTSIAIPKQDLIRLHGFQHRIVIDVQGTHIDATLDDPGNAMVRWALGTSNALQACVAAQRVAAAGERQGGGKELTGAAGDRRSRLKPGVMRPGFEATREHAVH